MAPQNNLILSKSFSGSNVTLNFPEVNYFKTFAYDFSDTFVESVDDVFSAVVKMLLLNMITGYFSLTVNPINFSLMVCCAGLVQIYVFMYPSTYALFAIYGCFLILFLVYICACTLNLIFPGTLLRNMKIFATICFVTCSLALPYDTWITIRIIVAIFCMKVVAMSFYIQNFEHYNTSFYFIGYLLHPATLLFGPFVFFEEYLAANIPVMRRSVEWILRIIEKFIQAIFFLLVGNYVFLVLIPPDAPRLLVLIRKGFQFRFYHYFLMSLCEANVIASGQKNTLMGEDGDEWTYSTFNWFKLETASNMYSALAFWNTKVAHFVVLHIMPDYTLYNVTAEGISIKIENLIKFMFFSYVMGRMPGLIVATNVATVLFVQTVLCANIRSLKGEQCFNGCCNKYWMYTLDRPKSRTCVCLYYFFKLSNAIYINFLSIPFKYWGEFYYFNYVVCSIQMLVLLVVKLIYGNVPIVMENDDLFVEIPNLNNVENLMPMMNGFVLHG